MYRLTSYDEDNLTKEIREALIRAQSDLPEFRSTITNKHAVIFLGNTRSGKSTLVNYVIGTKLVAFEERKGLFKIKKQDENATGPKIGQGVQSCTAIPGIYALDDNTVVIDAPGFDDNRGEAQDIINALYINQVRYARSVKFVLVSDINELMMDNIKGFTDLIEKMHVLLPDFEDVKTAMSIVFTKEDRKSSQEHIAYWLERKILDVYEFPINKELVRHFVENPELIAIFRMPTKARAVTNSIDKNIEEARTVSSPVTLDEVKVTVSPRSHLVLMQIYQEHLDSRFFEQQLEKATHKFSEYFEVDDYVFASLNRELADVKENLDRILALLNTETYRNIASVSGIKQSMIRVSNSTVLDHNLDLLVLIDDAMLMEDAIRIKFVTKYQQALKQLAKRVKKLLDKIEKETEEREETRTVLTASAGTAKVADMASTFGETMYRASEEGSTQQKVFRAVDVVGSIVSLFGAGVAGVTYILEKSKQEERMEARRRQGRHVYDNMFEDTITMFQGSQNPLRLTF